MAMYDIDAPVLLGRRAFSTTQAAWNTRSVTRRFTRLIDIGWYDSSVDAEDGAFALVDESSELTDLVGDLIKVTRSGALSVWVYVLGVADLDEFEIGLTRRAFMQIGILANESVPCVVEVV